PAPCCLLLPYTTLFRSRRLGQAGRAAVEREGDLVRAEEGVECLDDGGAVARVRRRVLGEVRRRTERVPACICHGVRVAVRVRQGDRKSTRLNSSHEWIS